MTWQDWDIYCERADEWAERGLTDWFSGELEEEEDAPSSNPKFL